MWSYTLDLISNYQLIYLVSIFGFYLFSELYYKVYDPYTTNF